MKVAVVIPAYNEAKKIAEVVRGIPKNIDGVTSLETIVVSDNSQDETAELARAAGARVLSHKLNLGQGGAILTGTYAAKRLGAEAVIIIDGDGQHDPEDMHHLVKAYLGGEGDLIIGSRFLSDSIDQMPMIKNFGNQVMNLITLFFSGVRLTDSQCGFRLFGSKFLEEVSSLVTTTGYEFCSEMIINANRQGLTIKEVPTSTIYFADRKVGTNPLHGLNILLRLTYKSLTRQQLPK